MVSIAWPCLHRITTKFPRSILSPNLSSSQRPPNLRQITEGESETGYAETLQTTRSVSAAGSSSSSGHWLDFSGAISFDICSFHAVCCRGLGTGAFVSAAGHGIPEF